MFKKLSRKELVLYCSSIVVGIIGFVFLLLGIIADNLGVTSDLYKAQGNFPWRYLGFIIIGVAVIFAIIVLCVFAKKIDRVTDREIRRKQRLSAMMSDIEKKDEIVVSDGKIVEDKPKAIEKEEEVDTKPVEELKSTSALSDTPVINPANNNDNNPGVK